MKQRLLLYLCVALALACAVRFHLRFRQPSLPGIDWQLLEAPTAAEIQEAERSTQPDNPQHWFQLAQLYRTFGLFPQADYCYRQVDALAPADPTYVYHWGILLDLMGSMEEAMEKFQRVIDLNASHPQASRLVQYCWLNIGQDRLRQNNGPAAEEALRRAGDLVKARLLLGRFLLHSGRAGEATVILDEVLAGAPDLLDALQLKSWAEQELLHETAAQALRSRALRAERRPALYDLTYPGVQDLRGRVGSLGWLGQARELAAKNQLPQARTLQARALEALWNEEYAQDLARIDLRLNAPGAAINELTNVIHRAGLSASTLELLGDAQWQAGQKTNAAQSWAQAAHFRGSPALHQKLARQATEAGQTLEASVFLGMKAYEEGKLAWKTNGLAGARSSFEEAIRLAPDFAPAWYYLGETRRLTGDADGAAQALRHCLKQQPGHGRAAEALARLSLP